MFFNKFFGGTTTTTDNNNNNNSTTTTTNVNSNENNNNNNNNIVGGGSSETSRFSGLSFGFDKSILTTGGLKKLGSSVQSYASNIYQKLEEETKKFVEEGPKSFDDSTMMPPWMDFQLDDKEKQTEIKEKILDLKMSRSTFLQSPPIDADYFQQFDDYLVKIATVSLKYDPILQKIRFHFVPKLISEEQFWKNWFYKVTVVKRQYNLVNSTNDIKVTEASKDNKDIIEDNNMSKPSPPYSPIQEESEFGKWEKELQSELDNFNINENDNIEFSLNNDLLNGDEDDEEFILELQRSSSQQQTALSSPIISTYSTPITDSDVDLEIERELQRMSQSHIIDKSTTEELIEEIESEILIAQKDGLVLTVDDNDDDDDDNINNCSNIEINNNSIEINNDYDNYNNNSNLIGGLKEEEESNNSNDDNSSPPSPQN